MGIEIQPIVLPDEGDVVEVALWAAPPTLAEGEAEEGFAERLRVYKRFERIRVRARLLGRAVWLDWLHRWDRAIAQERLRCKAACDAGESGAMLSTQGAEELSALGRELCVLGLVEVLHLQIGAHPLSGMEPSLASRKLEAVGLLADVRNAISRVQRPTDLERGCL